MLARSVCLDRVKWPLHHQDYFVGMMKFRSNILECVWLGGPSGMGPQFIGVWLWNKLGMEPSLVEYLQNIQVAPIP
jgi:hypothetical protein